MCLLSLRTWYCLIEGPPAIAKSGSVSCGFNDASEKMKMVALKVFNDRNEFLKVMKTWDLWKVLEMEELLAQKQP